MRSTTTKSTARWAALACLVGALATFATTARGGTMLILNEYNCVKSDEYLKDDKSDTYLGRVEGNGGNWIELVVTTDHADIRGCTLCWLEADGDGNGTPVWDSTRVTLNQSQGTITFGSAALWSDLRSGTIITISDKQSVETFDLSTDTSYNPFSGDWRIHVSSRQEAGRASPLVTTATNVTGDPAGAFSVGNDGWELSIFDGSTVVFGPIGELAAGWVAGGISDKEVGKLEVDPSGLVGNGDFKDGTSSTFGAPNVYAGGTKVQDFAELRAVVPEPASLVLLLTGLLGIALLTRTTSSR